MEKTQHGRAGLGGQRPEVPRGELGFASVPKNRLFDRPCATVVQVLGPGGHRVREPQTPEWRGAALSSDRLGLRLHVPNSVRATGDPVAVTVVWVCDRLQCRRRNGFEKAESEYGSGRAQAPLGSAERDVRAGYGDEGAMAQTSNQVAAKRRDLVAITLRSPEYPPAVYGQDLASDEVCPGEEDHCPGDVVRRADPLQRSRPCQRVPPRWRPVVRL